MNDFAALPERLNALRAFLFDFDGTLVHQRVDFARMRQRVLEVISAHMVPLEPLEGLPALEMIASARTAVAARNTGEAQALEREAQEAIVEVELQAAAEAVALPGAADLLGDLRRRGAGVAIVTRNCRAAVERVMAREGLVADVVLTRDDVEYVKPDARHLLDALNLLGASGPEAAMCGDHPMDIVAGRRVGALTIGLLADGEGPDHFRAAPPDLLVRRLDELRRLLAPKG